MQAAGPGRLLMPFLILRSKGHEMVRTLLTGTTSYMHTSLPDLIPVTRVGRSEADEPAAAAAAGCAAVNRAAIAAAIDAIAAALEKADDNVAANGEAAPGAEYPGAATFAQTGCQSALGTMQTLRAWLTVNELFEPPNDRVTNLSASFNVAGYCREAIIQLHFARHWAAVSSGWNAARNGGEPGRACTALISDALSMLEPLSANATSCYLR